MENNYWKLPIEVSEDGYLIARYNSLGISWREEKTPILAFPPGCKGEEGVMATEWQKSQLPSSMNMSAYLLFKHFCHSDDPDVFLEPTPIPERLTIAMGHYVSVVMECDRSITIYPTPAAFEEMDELLKMKPLDASYELFGDLLRNGWDSDFELYEQVTEDGAFYLDDDRGEGYFWVYGWSYDDYVFRLLHEDILLRGEAKMSYFRSDLSDIQRDVLYRQQNGVGDEPSLAKKLAEACGYEVIIE